MVSLEHAVRLQFQPLMTTRIGGATELFVPALSHSEDQVSQTWRSVRLPSHQNVNHLGTNAINKPHSPSKGAHTDMNNYSTTTAESGHRVGRHPKIV